VQHVNSDHEYLDYLHCAFYRLSNLFSYCSNHAFSIMYYIMYYEYDYDDDDISIFLLLLFSLLLLSES